MRILMERLRAHFTSSIILFCFVLVMACYVTGVARGLDSRITAGFELDAQAIAIALSRMWFGLHEGYIGYRDVFGTLYGSLSPNMYSPSGDAADMPNLSNPDSINAAFAAVKAIPVSSLPKYQFLSQAFVSMRYEDLGLVDFYHLAFRIFGVNATAMYNFYFLLMAASLAFFAAEYRKHPLPLLLCAAVLTVFPIFFFSGFFFQAFQLPSVNSNRFISTLGFIPILHALCIYFKQGEPLSRRTLLRLLAQAMIFAFAVSVRRTTQWQFLGLAVVGIAVAVRLLWPYRREAFITEPRAIYQQIRAGIPNEKKLAEMIGTYLIGWGKLLVKPLIAVMLIFFLVPQIYNKTQSLFLNPLYSTDCAIPYHMTWHSIYLGLSIHPDWKKIRPSNNQSDGIAWEVFENHMVSQGLQDEIHCRSTGGSYQFRLHEKIVKDEFFNFITKYPRFTLEAFFYYKPKALFATFETRLASVQSGFYLWLVAMSIAFGIFLSRFSSNRERQRIGRMAALTVPLSWLPDFVAYPVYSVDELWVLVIAAMLGVSLTIAWAIDRWHRAPAPLPR